MNHQIRDERIKLSLTSKENKQLEDLMQRLNIECNISSKRQSELIFQGFKELAENLLTSSSHHTHTKPQSRIQERKLRFIEILDSIKERGYLAYSAAYNDLLYSEAFSDMRIRSKSKHFQNLLAHEDIVILPVPKYFTTSATKPLFLIHKQGGWYNQLKELCISLNEQIIKVTDDNYSEVKFRDDLYNNILRRANYKINLDKAEKLMFNSFLFENHFIAEKPMIIDPISREVIQLRNQRKFSEAKELLQWEEAQRLHQYQEKKSKQAEQEANAILGGLL